MRRPIHSLSQIATVLRINIILIFIFSSIISYSQKTFAIAFDDTYGPHGTRETTTENGKTETTKYTITRIDWLDSAGRKRKSTERYWTDAKYKNPEIVHGDSTTTLYDSTGLTPTYTNRTVYDSTGKRISYQEEFYEHAIKVSGNGWVIRDGMVHPYTYDSYTKKVDSLPPTPYKGEDESPELHLNSPANSPAA